VEFLLITLLNGISYGLLLFMLSAGLTLIYSMLGVLNFAHASFYMLGAYFAYTLSGWLGFWPALVLAPLGVGMLGALVERFCLRAVRRFGHEAEMLLTFGLAYLIGEAVKLAWGLGPVPYRIPPELDGPLFTVWSSDFPAYRAFMAIVSLGMLAVLWLGLARTRAGLVVQAALTHPQMAEALGHDVPRVFMLVFAGGAALAGLAGVIGGNAFVTEPGMAAAVGAVVFVVAVVGGLGSLTGAFIASILLGLVQTFAVSADVSLASVLRAARIAGMAPSWIDAPFVRVSLAQVAPLLPYVLLVAMLAVRPRGLLGRREG
jgi:branched-chain amino acid transport system permease protein